MPAVLNYTPAWLSRPAAGFDLFTPNVRPGSSRGPRASVSSSAGRTSKRCPRRVIARRGAELFVVVNNQIRWADLSFVKNEWEEREASRKVEEDADIEESARPYRTLKVPVSEEILQLVVSPNESLMAILTSHTVHVAILPDSSHLGNPDTGPIRLKAHTLGPTAHVLSQSPVATALWHPLGVSGNCLVTVTAEAVVRVWELAIDNRWSFDSPSLAIDLQKLVDGSSVEEDFGASKIGTKKGFSPDSFEMEVASACFGGSGSQNETGWAAMTLWVAMTEGDVYALCPLLPSKWQPNPTTIPSLSVSIVSKQSSLSQDETGQKKREAEQQFQWISEIDNQEPTHTPRSHGYDDASDIFNRPAQPGAVPKLQGPFEIQALPEDEEEDLNTSLTDIFVIGAKLNANELQSSEEHGLDEGLDDKEALSITTVCLLNNRGRVNVSFGTEEIEGKWLPTKKNKRLSLLNNEEQPTLLVFESLDTLRQSELQQAPPVWPLFTSDPFSRYSFLVTSGRSITHLSLLPWVRDLENELEGVDAAGSEFRIQVLTEGARTSRERLLHVSSLGSRNLPDTPSDLSACVIFLDSDLGYFVLSAEEGRPHAINLEIPQEEDSVEEDESDYDPAEFKPPGDELVFSKLREVYQPSPAFWTENPLSAFLQAHMSGRSRRIMTDEIRLSQATLSVMADAHKMLSEHTYKLGVAASELFRSCERLQEEFKDQIRRSHDVAVRIESVADEDADQVGEDGTGLRGNSKIERRLENARSQQSELVERYDSLRRKLARSRGTALSDKERAWISEVGKLQTAVLPPEDKEEAQSNRNLACERFSEAKTLAAELLKRSSAIRRSEPPAEVPTSPRTPTRDSRPQSSHSISSAKSPFTFSSPSKTPNSRGVKVPAEVRKRKMAHVMDLLERETALVDATKGRLEQLTLGT